MPNNNKKSTIPKEVEKTNKEQEEGNNMVSISSNRNVENATRSHS